MPSSARADDGAIIVEGLVTDSITDTALPGAIVTLHRSAEESVPIAFCQTDDRGMFSLSLSGDQEAKVCRVRLLGYKAQTIAIDSSDPLTHLVIRLTRSSEQLPEVVVVGLPITHSGDTLTYRADEFRTNNTYSAEDLLKRLPGITVDTHGVISYMGKAVQGVMIESRDLVADNYRTATRVVRAEDIKSIDVLERYQRVKLLRGLKDGEGAMINIRLKDNTMHHPAGSVSPGLGRTHHRVIHELSADALLVRPTHQTLSAMYVGNSGSSNTPDISSQNKIPSTETVGILDKDVSGGNPSAGSLSSYNYGGTINQLLALTSDRTIKYNGGYAWTGSERQQDLKGSLYNGERNVPLIQSKRSRYKDQQGYLTIDYTVNDTTTYFKNDFRIELSKDHKTHNITRNETPLVEEIRGTEVRISDKISGIRRSGQEIKQFRGSIRYSRLPSLYRVVPSGPLAYRTDGSGQNVYGESSLSYGRLLSDHLILSGNAGLSASYGSVLISSLQSLMVQGGWVMAESSPELSYHDPRLKWGFSLPLSLSVSRFVTDSSRQSGQPMRARLGFATHISYRPSVRWRIAGRASYRDQDNPRLYDYLTGTYQSSFDQVVKKTSVAVRRIKTLSSTVDIEYRSAIDGIFASWTSTAISRKSNNLSDVIYRGTAREHIITERTSSSTLLISETHFSKYFSGISTVLTLSTGYNYSDLPILRRGEESRVRNHTFTCSGKVDANSPSWLELIGCAEVLWMSSSGRFGTQRGGDVSCSVTLSASPSEQWSFSASYTGSRILMAQERIPFRSFLDTDITYRHGRHRIVLACSNLLNTQWDPLLSFDRGDQSIINSVSRRRRTLLTYTLKF